LIYRVHVSLANFIDSVIDYPNAKQYAIMMFERLGQLGILSNEMIERYKQHVVNLMTEETSEES
jgi:hypothetical protein